MWFIDPRYLRSFDWISFFIMLVLSSLGLLFVFSSTYHINEPYSLYFKKQLFGIITGVIIYFIFCWFDYRTLERTGYFLYFAIIALLLFTLVKGSIGMGAQRWMSLGFIKFQPSELAKLFFPAFFSYYLFTEEKISFRSSLITLAPVLGVLALSFFIIAKQPDLGTALIVLFSGTALVWLAGMNKKFFMITILSCTLAAPVLWQCLKTYQRNRIMVFLGQGDSKKERYNLEQSRIAIGSGGLAGKGFLNSTQNQFMFLPASRTDFIFAVICEEWGFLGALILIFLYLLLFIRLFFVIASIKNVYAQLLGTGLIIHIVLSTLINMCMVIGLMPIVGIPLPFISYGVSNLWISFASLGWFNSIASRRFNLSLSASA